MKHLTALATALLLGSAAYAGDVALTDAWIADAPPASMTRAAYLTLENTGENIVGIVSVKAEGFGMAHLHESKMQSDGVMTMTSIDQVELAPGTELSMAPGGLHIMLMHPKAPIASGDTVAITFTFSDSTTLKVDAVVQEGPGEG